MTKHRLRGGQQIALGRLFGKGGEGAVYEVNGQPDIVAKIYDKPLDQKHAEKIEVLCTLRTDGLSAVCAWPVEPIYVNGITCGFIMPLVKEATEIHELFTSASRKRLFPNADWAFLIHVAKNLAAAIYNLHRANIVVGDVNQRNIVVTQDATVKLWDCDSFQVERNGRTYFCKVGVPEFTAPELQSCTSFDGVKRSTQHDCFSLAVMIFYLLFLGRHPFAGDPTDPSVKSLELQDAISLRKFAYSPNVSKTGVRPPRISPPVRELGLELLPYFVKAFETSNRPSSADWFKALGDLEKNLSRCSFNPGHVFPRRLDFCPWCNYEAQWSITTFLPTACPPRFVKPFDYAELFARVKHCFQDIHIVIPPESTSFRGILLPPIFCVAPELEIDLKQAKSRLAQWDAEIVKLNVLRQPDRQIAELTTQVHQAQGKYKSVKERSEALAVNAAVASDKFSHLQAQITSLCQSPAVGNPWLSLGLASILSAQVYYVTSSVILALPFAFGSAISTYFGPTLFRKKRLEYLQKLMLYWSIKLTHCDTERQQVNHQLQILESELMELKNVHTSLQKTDSDRIARIDILVAEAEIARQLVNDDLTKKQAAFFEAQVKYKRSIEQRKFEYQRRSNLVNALDAQRTQLVNKLSGMSCPNSLRDCRRQFNDAKNEYDRIQGLFLKELDKIRQSSRDRQMTEYLERYSIESLKPQGLGRSLLVNLKSRGIETAADVNRRAVLKVQGFGKVRTAMLLAWRSKLETGFVFDPSRLLSQHDRDTARLKYAIDFNKAEASLKRATEELRLAYDSAKQQVLEVERELAIVNENLGQSRANLLETP